MSGAVQVRAQAVNADREPEQPRGDAQASTASSTLFPGKRRRRVRQRRGDAAVRGASAVEV